MTKAKHDSAPAAAPAAPPATPLHAAIAEAAAARHHHGPLMTKTPVIGAVLTNVVAYLAGTASLTNNLSIDFSLPSGQQYYTGT